MKCESCQKLLEEYFDGALIEFEAEQIGAHLIACAGCANELDLLAAEQEIYARYDRGFEIAPSMWSAIAARTTEQRPAIYSGSRYGLRDGINRLCAPPSWSISLAGAIAVLVVAGVIGLAYLKTHQQGPPRGAIALGTKTGPAGPKGEKVQMPIPTAVRTPAAVAMSEPTALKILAKAPVRAGGNSKSSLPGKPGIASQTDVLFSDVAYSAAEEQETLKHIEQAQNLLRSVRNLQVSDDDGEIDVSYEKALSRRLLNENVVLRRDAEMSGKFPVKTLLSSLEPFLIDIANLPDKTSAEDLRVIKERVQKTEIVAALHSY